MTDDEFVERFNELHKYISDKRYWEGWNAGLDWAHRIVRGDKSAD